jgi:hypothetical protein
MDSATFQRIVQHVGMGADIEAPGTAADEPWFDDVADVFVRPIDPTDF